MIERTLVILKPDAVEQGIGREIMTEMLDAGLSILNLAQRSLTYAEVVEHYPHHAGKPYFPAIAAFMTRGPCIVMIVEGEDAVRRVREMAGATDPSKAAPETWRGRWGRHANGAMENVVHASGTAAEAEEEIRRFYPPGT